MWSVALTFVLSATAPAPNQAEKLFRAMEKALASAKTLQVTFTHTTAVSPDDGPKKSKKLRKERLWKGTLTLAAGDKLRFEGEWEVRQLLYRSPLKIVSDGSRMRFERGIYRLEGVESHSSTHPTPRGLNKEVVGCLTRLGLAGGLEMALELMEEGSPKTEKSEPEDDLQKFLTDELPVSGFKLGKRVKLGGREARAITYEVGCGTERHRATVLIDPRTNLPLKVRFVSEGARITEVYTDFRINASVDGGKFRLPE
jgi:outer membrane lipoprotein-sorting protein